MNYMTTPMVAGILTVIGAAVWYYTTGTSFDDSLRAAGIALVGVGIMIYAAFFYKPPSNRSGKTSKHWYTD
jgi:hypothetical protein